MWLFFLGPATCTTEQHTHMWQCSNRPEHKQLFWVGHYIGKNSTAKLFNFFSIIIFFTILGLKSGDFYYYLLKKKKIVHYNSPRYIKKLLDTVCVVLPTHAKAANCWDVKICLTLCHETVKEKEQIPIAINVTYLSLTLVIR